MMRKGKKFGLCAAAIMAACTGAMAEDPVRVGDIAVGLGITVNTTTGTEAFSRNNTLRQVRGGERLLPGWTDAPEAQSVEFDNAGGLSHNARGNLLGLVFNPLASSSELLCNEGGSLWQISTDGSNNATKLFVFDQASTGETLPPISSGGACVFSPAGSRDGRQRMGGLSVAPDNSKVAAMSFDSNRLFVLDYNEGLAVGTGAGASVSNFRKSAALGTIGHTAGTAWLDNNTVIVVHTFVQIPRLYTVDATTMVATDRVDLPTFNNSGNSRVTEVEYNPLISPYIYVLYSLFAGDTENRLAVVDPASWTTIKTINLGSTLETGRELAFGPDMRLYISQFAGGGSVRFVDVLELDLVAPFGVIDLNDTLALTDNSSFDHYRKSDADVTGTPAIISNFNGLDVALQSPIVDPAPTPVGSCCLPGGQGCVALVTANVCTTVLLGTYNGDNSGCGACPDPVGACCTGSSVCTLVTESECDAIGGLYFGDGAPCATGACPGEGACCFADGTCLVLLPRDCYGQGGHFRGINSVCGACPAVPSAEIVNFDFEFAEPFTPEGRRLAFVRSPDLSGSPTPGTFVDASGNPYPSSTNDVFGVVERGVNVRFADDTPPGTLPQDTFGIIPADFVGRFFGVADLFNNLDGGTGNGFATAEWSFDVSGFENLAVTIDMAAMGNFEAANSIVSTPDGNVTSPRDAFDFSYSIDGGPFQPLFTSSVANNVPYYQVMNAGTRAQYDIGASLRDPIRMLAAGDSAPITVRNEFLRLIARGIPAGSTLTIRLAAQGDGSFEVFGFDNIRVLGDEIVTVCPGNYNGDGSVDLLDLLAFNADWSANLGQSVTPGSAGDYNGNGAVDLLDLLAFNADWSTNLGQSCP